MERAPGRPSTQTSSLKPSGSLSLSTGSSFADFPVTSIANGCRVDFSCSVLRPCCQEGGAAGAAGACACAATAVSAQASVQVKEMSQRNGAEYMEYPPFAGCCCLRGGAAVQSTGRSGIIATLDPVRNMSDPRSSGDATCPSSRLRGHGRDRRGLYVLTARIALTSRCLSIQYAQGTKTASAMSPAIATAFSLGGGGDHGPGT